VKILLSFLLISLILLAACSTPASPATETPSPTPSPSAIPSPSPSPSPEPQMQSFEPITITGSGDKTSPPFTVTTEEWIIDWSYNTDEPEYAVFGFFVYPRGETDIYIESVLFPESTEGSTYSYAGQGDYYVKVSASNVKSWIITIKPAE